MYLSCALRSIIGPDFLSSCDVIATLWLLQCIKAFGEGGGLDASLASCRVLAASTGNKNRHDFQEKHLNSKS